MLKLFVALAACIIFLTSSALAESGCGAMPVPKVDGTQDVVKSATTGAVLGGLAGGLLGSRSKSKGDVAKNAAIGSAIGGLIGGMAGKEAADRRQEYTTQSAFLDCEINYVQGEIAHRETVISNAESERQASLAKIEEIKDLIDQNLATEQELQAIKVSLEGTVAALNSEIVLTSSDIEKIDGMTPEIKPLEGESEEELLIRRNQLAEQRNALFAQYQGLINVRDQMMVAAASATIDQG